MKIDTYLRINSRGKVQVCKRQPRLAGDEVAVRVVMDLPAHLFKRPRLSISPTIFGIPAEASADDLTATAEFAGAGDESLAEPGP